MAISADLRGKTILQVLPALGQGGVERGTIDVALALKAAGARAMVASAGGPGVQTLEAAGVEHVTLPLDRKMPWALLANGRALTDLARREGVDVLHARSRGPAWSCFYAARQLGLPWITTFHGTYNFSNAVKKYYNSVMVRGDRVIAISEFIQEHIQKNYGVSDRVRLIPRGVDLELFKPGPDLSARSASLRKSWDVPQDAPLLLMVGRLTRWKGQEVLLQALSSGQYAVFLGAHQGRAAYASDLMALAAARGIADRVRFVETCADMPAAYDAADVVIHASTDPEAFGRVIVEAQAMGRFVIATDHGAPPEILIPGVTGALVAPGSVDELAHAIAVFFETTPKARAAAAEKARAHMERYFSKEAMLAQTFDVYREVL